MTRRDVLRSGGALAAGLAARTGAFGQDSVSAKAPVLLVTPKMLTETRGLLEGKEAAWTSAWEKTRTRAMDSLKVIPEPYQGEEYLRYYRTGRGQAGLARDTAVTFALTGEARFADKAKQMLLAWAADFEKNSSPASDHPINQALVIARVMVVFCNAYSLIFETTSPSERRRIENWMERQVPLLREGQKRWVDSGYFGGQRFNNHVGAQTMGMAVLGFTLGDKELVNYALRGEANPRNFARLVEGVVLRPGDTLYEKDPTLTAGAPAVQAGEGYDRYRSDGKKGLHYTLLHLRLLTLIAEIAHNYGEKIEGKDPYLFTGTKGRSLETAYTFYADFFITKDAAARGGYYARETVVPSDACLYEIAARRYPKNSKIRDVLAAHDRAVFDLETFGWTALLTHGISLK